MTDDISQIPTGGCNVISSDTTIYNYSSGVRKTFRQIGGKWYLTEQNNYNTIPTQYVCVDISGISSNAVYEPILYMVSFVLFISCVWLFYFVIRKLLYAVKM